MCLRFVCADFVSPFTSSPTRPAYCATDVVKRRHSKKKKGQKSTAGRDEFNRGVDSLRLRATPKPNHLKIAKCITRM